MAAKTPSDPPKDAPDDGRDDQTGALFGEATGAPAVYQVLARKYRPRTFEDLVGQEAMVRTLNNAFRTGRIAHAFMLTGVRGVGKTTTARLLARALNYETDTVHQPSMQLDPPGVHCAAIMASTHPDVLELDAASRTGVSDMRELLDGSRYAPVSARYKVYIIDEVHMLSTAAFNALLKTLEEPPPHVKFIFATTEIRRVPVTVLSRCQRFNLQRFSTEELAAHLERICAKEGAKVAHDALALIARAAEGSARDGLSILDQAIVQGASAEGGGGEVSAETVREMLGLADRSRVLDLLERAVAGEHRAALEEAAALLEAGADASVLIKDMMEAVVEISRAQALKETYRFAGPADWGARTLAMARKLSPAQSARIWRLLLQGFEDCARAPDPPAAAQMVVLRVAAAAALPPPEEAAKFRGAGADGAGASQNAHRQPVREEAAGPAEASAAPVTYEDEPQGPRLASLREIVAELDRQRQIDLRYDIESFVRPAEIDYGHFRYTAAPGAPNDLSNRIKQWLERTSGVEWEVLQANDGAAESAAEARVRRKKERLSAAEAHPRVKEALKAFPGARVLRVDEPEAPDLLLEDEETPISASGGNVVHVDFAAHHGAEQTPPDAHPDPEEDDD
jgi:DNA polymerase-3 subunit gamma/tau